MVKKCIQQLMAVMFPATCCGCGRVGTYLCQGCLHGKVNQVFELLCPVCGLPVYSGNLVHNDCAGLTYLDGLIAIARYESGLQGMLHAGKYQFASSIYSELGELLAVKLLEARKLLPHELSVSYVPLTSYKANWRGFNQAELLAHSVAGYWRLPLIDLLERKEVKHSQVGLGKGERIDNIRGQFAIRPEEVVPANVLLIDDVFTTGATLNECARILKLAGVQNVVGLTVAKA